MTKSMQTGLDLCCGFKDVLPQILVHNGSVAPIAGRAQNGSITAFKQMLRVGAG